MRAGDWLRRFAGDGRGNTAIVFALALPALALVGAGAVELTFLVSDRGKMQDVADSAALAGARELTLAMQEGSLERAKVHAEQALADIKSRSSVSVDAQVVSEGAGMKVTIASHRASFFGNLLPPGGFNIRVEAVAERMGSAPLCVLSTKMSNTIDDPGGAAKERGLRVKDDSTLTAGGCMVFSNANILVDNKALVAAAAVQSVGDATGRITPQAQIGASPIDDPFIGVDTTGSSYCQPVTDLLLNLGLSLTAGTHCGDIRVGKGQTLLLAPGVHYFKQGELRLEKDAQLIGRNAVLVFDKGSRLTLKDDSVLDLEGRKTGEYAGFVIATTPQNDKVFELSSTSAKKLLGTVYIPGAKLKITGAKNKVAAQSPWTVIVAQAIELQGSPDLVINSNYGVGGVPVPVGVGPNAAANARLTQ